MLAAVTIVVVRTSFLGVPEIVRFGEEVGSVLYDASLAYATAWLFQLLVIVRPDRARRIRSNRVVAPRIFDLVRPARQLVHHLSTTARRQDVTWPPTQQQLTELCSKIDTTKPPREVLTNSWWTYLEYIQRMRQEAQLRLEPYYDRIDEDLLELLNTEREAGSMLRQFRPEMPTPTNATLEAWVGDFYKWTQAEAALYTHANTVLSPNYYVEDDIAPGASTTD